MWRVSVRELAGVEGAGEWAGVPGMGQRVHARIRQERESSGLDWVGERYVAQRMDVEGVAVLVSGRLDGLFRAADGTYVVEEIKSLAGSVRSLGPLDVPPALLRAAMWQTRIYEHLLALELSEDVQVTGRVVFADPWAGELFSVDVPYEPDRVARFLARRLSELLEDRRRKESRARARRELARELAFPFGAYRPFQDQVAEDVAGAVRQGMNLVLSAPTGIGKTAGVLYPALRECLARGRRLLFATSRVSQQDLALTTLEHLLPAGGLVTAVQLEAKERSCPMEEMLCLPEHCTRLRSHAEKMRLAGLPDRLLDGGVVRAGDIRAAADQAGLCPFRLGLALAASADVLVGDVNYVLHPRVRLQDLHEEDGAAVSPRPWVVIVDEAHGLPERARDFLSPALGLNRVRALAEAAELGPASVFQEMAQVLRAVEEQFQELVRAIEESGRAVGPKVVVEPSRGIWEELAARFEALLWEYFGYLASGGKRPRQLLPRPVEGSRRVVDPVVAFFHDFEDFCQAVESTSEDRVVVLTASGQDLELQAVCLDPARYLRERFGEFSAVVAMSATLEPLDYYAEALGLDGPNLAKAAYPSPFPRRNRLIVADTSVGTRYRDRTDSLQTIAEKVLRVSLLRPGNHLLFAPSYGYLRLLVPHIERRIRAMGLPVSLLVAWQADLAPVVIETLRRRAQSEQRDSLLVCTVLGGSLSEGVDLPGDMAHTAMVVSPGLPQVTFERNLVAGRVDAVGGDGFVRAYLVPGLSAVVQAAGRVIRSETDVGAVVLFGQRFGEPRYLGLLPSYWQAELQVADDCVPVVERFWRERGVQPL